jgi:hypothetical protein
MATNFDNLFGILPSGLRNELRDRFDDIVNHYYEQKWEPSELNGGKFCEAAYTVLEGFALGSYLPTAHKPKNMEQACRQLANQGKGADSVRLSIPRAIVALYDIRNRRGVGHVGGEVNPNHMDAMYVLSSAKWILGELIRVYNGVTTQEAQKAVEELSQREMPLIWSSAEIKRVLVKGLSKRDETILLLYSMDDGKSTEKELLKNTEHSNGSIYRSDVLVPNHKRRLWEYHKASGTVTLLPPGIKTAEDLILKYAHKQ